MTNFIDDNTDLDFKENARITAPGQAYKTIRAEDWNRVVQALYDTRSAVLDVRAGARAWAAGTYQANAVVTRGPYLFRANIETSEDPLLVEGDLGLNTDWTVQTTSGSGMSQGSGQTLLINGIGGKATTCYRQSINSGFLGKMLMIDTSISGAADWLHFGVFDSSAVQSADNINTASSGFYGVNINIFDQRVENWINGAAGTNASYTNAAATNAAEAFSRWYLKMIQNGSNWDLTLYRDSRVASSSINGQDNECVDDLQVVAAFTNVARPAYTNWRFVVGARTGGSFGIFKCRAAYVRNVISAHWTPIGRLPTQLG